MDIYGDWIYIGAMVLSGIGSGAAAMLGLTRARARKAALELIDRLIDLKQAAHKTMSLPQLAELDRQIEELSTNGLRFARDHDFDEAGREDAIHKPVMMESPARRPAGKRDRGASASMRRWRSAPIFPEVRCTDR